MATPKVSEGVHRTWYRNNLMSVSSQVNAVIYGSILKGFSRKKHMDRVWEAFDEMKAHGFQVAKKSQCDSGGRKTSTDEFFEFSPLCLGLGITPTLMTFNAIMDGCVRNEEMSKATWLKHKLPLEVWTLDLEAVKLVERYADSPV